MRKTAIPHNGVLTLSGYGVRLAVERGHLVVEDGVADERRVGRFSRIDRDLKRVVIIGHSGTVSLDTIAWLHGVGVPLIHLDHDGRIYFVSAPAGLTIAQLRRAQARAAENGAGIAISRDLLTTKLQRQQELLRALPDGESAVRPLADLLHRAEHARTPSRASRLRGPCGARVLAGVASGPNSVRPD